MIKHSDHGVDVLLIDDHPGDVRLTEEAFSDGKAGIHLHVASDGEEAMAFLRREGKHATSVRPDLILLDLNLPRKNGRAVLAEIRADPTLTSIPVIVLTTSASERDVEEAYRLHANCYVTKPVDLDSFFSVVRLIQEFWLTAVQLPGRRRP